jgi:CheY-like chemotaxis protein
VVCDGGDEIPILVASASQSPAEIEAANAAGGNGFVAKPFDVGTLIARIEELLGQT